MDYYLPPDKIWLENSPKLIVSEKYQLTKIENGLVSLPIKKKTLVSKILYASNYPKKVPFGTTNRHKQKTIENRKRATQKLNNELAVIKTQIENNQPAIDAANSKLSYFTSEIEKAKDIIRTAGASNSLKAMLITKYGREYPLPNSYFKSVEFKKSFEDSMGSIYPPAIAYATSAKVTGKIYVDVTDLEKLRSDKDLLSDEFENGHTEKAALKGIVKRWIESKDKELIAEYGEEKSLFYKKISFEEDVKKAYSDRNITSHLFNKAWNSAIIYEGRKKGGNRGKES